MLNISKALSASQAQTYHAREFTSAEQNYRQDPVPLLHQLLWRWPESQQMSEDLLWRLHEKLTLTIGSRLVERCGDRFRLSAPT